MLSALVGFAASLLCYVIYVSFHQGAGYLTGHIRSAIAHQPRAGRWRCTIAPTAACLQPYTLPMPTLSKEDIRLHALITRPHRTCPRSHTQRNAALAERHHHLVRHADAHLRHVRFFRQQACGSTSSTAQTPTYGSWY